MRARVAVQGANVEALTGGETFRIPVARASVARHGRRIVVHDEQSELEIWSEDDAFLDVLERAQRGTLREQVGRIRSAARARKVAARSVRALAVLAAMMIASVPFMRWAIRGGIPAFSASLGESALDHLALPSGEAPAVEKHLAEVAEQLRPATAPSMRHFRVLLADYGDVHSFGLPAGTIIVTAGLVCGAEDPDLVTEAIARELAHLENHDVSHRVAEAVDWRTPFDLLHGDLGRLRDRMLDFADPKRSPGFTPAQEKAADERATALLERALPHASFQQLAALTARLQQLQVPSADAPPPRAPAKAEGALDWSKVRAEACGIIGH